MEAKDFRNISSFFRDDANSEFTYYPYFEKWLQNDGYKTYTSVRIWNGTELDVVGIKHFKTVPPKLTIIEVKMRDWEAVKHQCVKRLSMAEEVYMGLVMRSDISYFIYKLGQDIDFLERHKIGLLIYDVVRKRMFKIISPKNQKYLREIPIIEEYKKSVIDTCTSSLDFTN